MSVSCSIQPAEPLVKVLGLSNVPNLLTLPHHLHIVGTGSGLLLTSIFSINMQSSLPNSVNISFIVEPNFKTDAKFQILVGSLKVSWYALSQGQTIALPAQIFSNDKNIGIPCKTQPAFNIFIIYGNTKLKIPVDLECRRYDQSFLVSFQDHDGSASQAAVLFPLHSISHETHTAIKKSSFKAILSLHGTGISAMSQADAYKTMPVRKTSYEFGVENYFVVAPTRHGAHYWEAVGAETARSSLFAAQAALKNHPILPQLVDKGGIIAGHSMGGHGAWIVSKREK